ncbi:MAG: hypothetical protein OHK0015_19740 [Chloroflexi bacterium OHK40]
MTYRILTLLDWALISASLFNTVALLWLGLTVLLNAERRSWGTWVAGGGLLVGAAFFVGHTAVVGRMIGTFSGEMELWWRIGWLVLVGAPYLWYLVMAWYSGALRRPAARRLLAGVSLVGLCAVALLLFADPLPSYGDVLTRSPAPLFAAGPLPAVALVYPVFSVCCSLLALGVLRHPADTDRFMGEEARRRARPWLVAATVVLLAVSFAVGAAAAWVLQQVRQGDLPGLSARVLSAIMLFDLAVSLLVATTVVLIGQAVVAYEVFTGKALPRGELRRQWRRALLLAAGYGLAVGWSLSGAGIPELPIYQLLLATVLMTAFFALLGWRSFAERERALGGLRPFVSGERLFEGLLRPGASAGDSALPFRALCGELLGASRAYLIPLGPLAPLAGPPLAMPSGAEPPALAAATLVAALPSPPPLCVPVDPTAHAGAVWAVPLLGERGLIGLLMLGEKRDGGLYTAEEIALARAAGERLVDGQAASEMGRRLVALQRRRLAEGQVLDRRARRLLHDEVLPRLHAGMLALAAPAPGRAGGPLGAPEADTREAELIALLADVHKQISDLLHDLPPVAGPELERHGPLGALRRAVERELPDAFDDVCWAIAPDAEAAARTLDPLAAETLYYAAREAARNAARHGRGANPARPLRLAVSAACRSGPGRPPALEVCVEDDGVGIAPGRGPTSAQPVAKAVSGAGLTLHSTLLAILGGALVVESAPGGPSRVLVSVPLELVPPDATYPTG